MPNVGLNILYNRYFRKKGRNLSLSLSQSSLSSTINTNNLGFTRFYTSPGTYQDSLINQQINQTNKGYNYSFNLNYSEPVSKSSNLDFTYMHNFSKSNNNRMVEVYNYGMNAYQFNSLLSNDFTNSFNSDAIGLSLRTIKKKYNYSIGINLLPVNTKIYSEKQDSLNKPHRVINISPFARFSYVFSRSKNLSFSYRGYSRQPNY